MMYIIAASLAILASAQIEPPLGYPSAQLELADGESGYFMLEGAQITESAMSANVTGCSVGMWISYDAGSNAAGAIWLGDSATSETPGDQIQYIDSEVTTGNFNTEMVYAVYDLCGDSYDDVYVHIEGACSATSGCISTADFNVAYGLFTGLDSAISTLPDISVYWGTPVGDAVAYDAFPTSSMSRTAVTEPDSNDALEALFGSYEDSGVYALPVIWPSTHPQVQTVENSELNLQGYLPQEPEDGMGRWGITHTMDWSLTGESGVGLYVTTEVAAQALYTEFALCFNFESNPQITWPMISSENLTNACDICYPSDCESFIEGQIEAESIAIQTSSLAAGYSSVMMTTYINDIPTAGTSFHSVCGNWGSFCSPASTLAPSVMVLALGYLASLF